MSQIKRYLLLNCLLITIYCTIGLCKSAAIAFEAVDDYVPSTQLDTLVLDKLSENQIEPANLCSDEVFIRRIYIDVAGTLPPYKRVEAFVADKSRDKRAKLIDEILETEEYIDYTTMKWCNLLRVKSEFPINLWPNAVQAYHRWIKEAVRDNMPYDKMAAALLTTNGSNFRDPPVNFYRAMQGKSSADIASAVALTFMGIRLANQPEEFAKNMQPFFSQVGFKSTGEWKEEIICFNPSSNTALEATLPDGKKITIEPKQDPRLIFTDWLIAPENKFFSRCIANRIWAEYFSRGIIEPADDLHTDIAPSNPKLLEYLQKELVNSGYDLKHLRRVILNSRCYQLSSLPQSDNPEAAKLFAYYQTKRIDAEVLIDALCDLSGVREKYSSMVPEPYTFIPEQNRTIALADGSITSQFLEMFGRPARDLGTLDERNSNPSDSQLLHMLNSTDIHNRIKKSQPLNKIVWSSKTNRMMIKRIYLLTISRYPTDNELQTIEKYIKDNKLAKKTAAEDIMWALINTKEFLYRH